MIRTRFAPSPTGYAHVGSIRTALFAFLVARQGGGQFVLRLEDTDKKREVAGSDEHLFRSLHALGLDYDEGPDIGGPFGPYRQSERLDSYKKWAEQLIAAGRAYADPYSPEEVQKFREEAEKTDRPFHFRNHRPENPPAWDGSQPLRFNSDPHPYRWPAAVMGDLSAGADAIDDFVLIKSDGYPTYNFAHIVDDAEMKISHIIRGQEFISSTPNYLNLYEALSLEHPIFATMPHILNETGNKKLGKRDGAKDVLEYFREGFLQEALVNFIASLGWNDGTEQEIFSVEELIAKFTLDRVGRSGARFDEKRLLWLNGQWVKRLSLDDLYNRSMSGAATTSHAGSGVTTPASTTEPRNDGREGVVRESSAAEASPLANNNLNFWGSNGAQADEQRQKEVLAIVQDRLKTLADLPALTEYFFKRPEPNWQMIDDNKQLSKLSHSEQIGLLQAATDKLSKISETNWNQESLQNTLNQLLIETNSKPPILFGLIRFTLTWAPFSPGLPETMQLLGQQEVVDRIDLARRSIS